LNTILRVVCLYCGCAMGEQDGRGVSGTSHSICRKCWEEKLGGEYGEYPECPEEHSEYQNKHQNTRILTPE